MRISDWSSDVCSSDLSDRFALQPMALPDGVTMTVEPSASPMPALNKYVFRFADPDPVKLRFRYGGPIATEHDSGNKPLRPEGYELFLDHMRSEEHTSELQSLMRISYAGFCLKKKKIIKQ